MGMTTGGSSPHDPPPPARLAWHLLAGVLVLLLLLGLVLLVLPQPWKAALVFVLVVAWLAFLRRLIWLSRSQKRSQRHEHQVPVAQGSSQSQQDPCSLGK